jgi:hypothetical protein
MMTDFTDYRNSPAYRQACMNIKLAALRSLLCLLADDPQRDTIYARYERIHGEDATHELRNMERGVRSGKYQVESFQ